MSGYASVTACTGWDNGDCVGTTDCPPRCPRFFDNHGLPILVRPYEEDDLEDLIAMYDRFESALTSGVPLESRSSIERWLRTLTADGWNLIATDSDRVIGHVAIAPADADEPELVIFVDEAYQGRGIGSELMHQLIAYAAAHDHTALQLFVEQRNETAIAVYRNTSFDIAGEQFGTIAMRLSLDQPIAEAVRRPPAER